MRDWQGKRYWILGADKALGAALARVMSRAGVELVLSGSDDRRLKSLEGELPGHAHPVPVDVADRASIARAAAQAGEPDGVVWLEGKCWKVSARSWDSARVEEMLDTGLTGAARVIGAVLPAMVANGAGHVVLTGSLAAFRGLPDSVGHSAAKAGLYALAESMQLDLRGTGVEVQIVNPGNVRGMVTGEHGPSLDPELAAHEIFEHMGTDSFAKSFPLGPALAFRLSPFLPGWAYTRLFG